MSVLKRIKNGAAGAVGGVFAGALVIPLGIVLVIGRDTHGPGTTAAGVGIGLGLLALGLVGILVGAGVLGALGRLVGLPMILTIPGIYFGTCAILGGILGATTEF